MTTITVLNALLILAGLIHLIYLIAFASVSLREGERRAALLAFLLAIALSAPLFLATLVAALVKWILLGMVGAIWLVGLILFLLPIGTVAHLDDVPTKRFDERDIVFARKRLMPGSPEFEAYYAMRPEKRAMDDKRRAQPGLLSPKALKADTTFFAAAKANFALTEAMRDEVDGPISDEQVAITPSQGTSMVKKLAQYHGALAVGICEV